MIEYYERVAPWMIPHVKDRPVTRKRWANGVDGKVFFEKNLPDSAPDWIRHHTIAHKEHDTEYPIVDDVATLVWMAQQAALELHVPQWRFGPRGAHQNPDRLVLDLDPGEGVGLPECVEVAVAAREVLQGMGLEPYPVTSGSKGIHLYAALDGRATTNQVSDVAHELARALEQDLPDLVLSSMSRAERAGKVFVDWSQNNGNKTTIAPYSLRGRDRPTVAAPRTWDELTQRGLAQLTLDDVLDRLEARGDLLHPVASASLSVGRPDHGHWDGERTEDANRASEDRLTAYRAKRDAAKTPEPVPAGAPTVREDGTPTFVIQEHHATRDHYDFRLEHEGVLVSWALPKGEPTDPGKNHLAVQTEDHPLEYGSFEGSSRLPSTAAGPSRSGTTARTSSRSGARAKRSSSPCTAGPGCTTPGAPAHPGSRTRPRRRREELAHPPHEGPARSRTRWHGGRDASGGGDPRLPADGEGDQRLDRAPGGTPHHAGHPGEGRAATRPR